jgi:PAS domain S-box-containing protein
LKVLQNVNYFPGKRYFFMTTPNGSSPEQARVGTPPPTILVIDDNPHILEALASWLTTAGFLTISALSGDAGLALFHSQPVDLVLTDLIMPGGDGFKVLSTISQENPELPVIIISGAGDLQDSIRALRLGAWDYICKPMDSLLLLHQITLALERAALLKENNRSRQSQQLEIEQRTTQLQQRTADLEQANLRLHREIEARQQIEDELNAANDQWQTTFDSMPDFISIHDQSYTIIKVNKALSDFLGQAPEALIGQKCHQLFHGSCEPWSNCPHRELLITGLPHSCEVIDPHIGRPLMVSVSPIRFEGHVIGSVHVAKDISQQKKLAEERQKNKNLESISVLCGGLAHDFNNLLTALSGYIDLAKREKHTERLPHWLDSAKMVTNLAAELTKQLLIFSKGGFPILNYISVYMLIQDSVTILTNTLNQVRPEVHIAKDIWPIMGDQDQLRTVIKNIFYNAAEAMPTGGSLTIEAHNIPKGTDSPLDQDAILLSFTDQGGGISPEIIDKVFDPYFSTSAKGATKGKGLGLALCHSIITKHHGKISLASKKNHGTTVSIYLPASPTASAT